MADELTTPAAPRAAHDESPVWAAILLGAVVVLVVVGMVMNSGKSANYPQWQTLLGVLATLGIMSILYKENPIFRFCEHIFIGLATGYSIVITWVAFIQPKWLVPMVPNVLAPATAENPGGLGEWWLIFALLFGLLFFTVYFPKITWMNRFILGALMGFFGGNVLQQFIGLLGPQLVTSFKPPITTYTTPDGAAGNNIAWLGLYWHPFSLVFIIVLLCTLAYFFFSVEHRSRIMRQPAVAGRYFLMITLGAIFGTTVMARFSLVINRFDFLIHAVGGWWGALFH